MASLLRVKFLNDFFYWNALTEYILARNHIIRISLQRIWYRCTSRRSRDIHPWGPNLRDLLWSPSAHYLSLLPFRSKSLPGGPDPPQEMAFNHKGQVKPCHHREYGFAHIQIGKIGNGSSVDALFEGLGNEMQVYLFSISQPETSYLRDTCRFGCLTETNSPPSHPISTSSDPQKLPLSQPSHMTQNRSTEFSSTPKSHIHPEERKSSQDLYWIYVDVIRTGQWRNSLGRRLLG